jgi:mannan endo-1,4-beta-mannosidase
MSASSAASTVVPVTPGASREAVGLLGFIREISGRRIMAGQHAAPLVGTTRLPEAHRAAGRYPALFGQDFGFSPPGTWDGINFRQRIVDEAIRRHGEGFVITLMWHAVRPIENEPVAFEQSIQGKVTDEQWRDLVTPGTEVHERWKSQVDVIAWHLAQLRDARVPVLWRPYHEMNGGWFWWGKKSGDGGYKKLYRMLFDRFTRFHGLNNLVWVYNCNEVSGPHVDPYATHYPGPDVVDILATDVYRGGYARADYEQLLAVAGDKPVAIGECGAPPPDEVLAAQPRWTWFMLWGDPTAPFKDGQSLRKAYAHERTLTHDQLPWVTTKSPHIHYPILR